MQIKPHDLSIIVNLPDIEIFRPSDIMIIGASEVESSKME
jgi:hypothetical protein